MLCKYYIINLNSMNRFLFLGVLINFISLPFTYTQTERTVQSQYRFKYLTVDQGLSNNRVKTISQDSQGFIWIATNDGIDKFDGQTVFTYRHDSLDSTTILSNDVNTIFQDSKNSLWIGSSEGLNIYNSNLNIFNRFSHEDIDWPIGKVNAIAEDKEGRLWIGASSGLYAYNLNTLKIKYFSNKENNPRGIPQNQISRLLVDKKGNVWFSVRENGLCRYNPNDDSFDFYKNDPENSSSISDNQIESLYEDNNGDLWAGTLNNGINLYVPGSNSFIRTIPDPENNYSTRVRAIFEDLKGDLFLGTSAGLYRRNNNTNEYDHYAYEGHNFSRLTQNSILCSFIDNTGTLWIGTFSGGINYTNLNKKEFIHYQAGKDNNKFLSGANIFAITEDQKGNLWVGGTNGLNYLDKTTYTFKYFLNDPNNPFSLSYNDIKALECDKKGNLWIGTNKGGLNYYNTETGKFISYKHDPEKPNSISGNRIYGLLSDIDNNLWIITNTTADAQYLSVDYLPNGSEEFTHLNEKSYFGLDEDENGDIYIGGVNGFWIFSKNDSIYSFISNDIIGNVNTIKKDSENRIWIGSEKGLARYNIEDKSFARFSKDNGYPISEVFGILEDNSKNLWVSTNSGLIKIINITENIENDKIKVFDSEDGLQSKQFNYNAYFKSRSGEMAFGGINGFNTFYPENIVENPLPPNVLLTDLKILNTTCPIGEKVNGRIILDKSISSIDEIKLRERQNVFTLEFAALHYANPKKNIFKYKLEGFDKNWQFRNAGSNFASYSNLPAGDYTFFLTAANNDGVWNENLLQLKIKIIPAFWKTFWFYALVIASIIFVVWIFLKMREKQVKLDKEQLKKELDKGKAEIEKQKEEILQHQDFIKQKEEQVAISKWFNEGIVKFSDLLSSNQENAEKLLQEVISNLVPYVQADQGGIFLINDENQVEEKKDEVLELIASYAYSEDKLEKNSFLSGEGLIGTCFRDSKTIRIDNLPPDYTVIGSGLGEHSPKHLVLIPIKLGEYKIGVIELTSFQPIEENKVELIEKIAENITSILSIMRSKEHALQTANTANLQKEELLEQEEEIRQTMEEMKATQDSLQEQAAENMKLQKDLIKENAYLNAIMSNLPDYIYFKDKESRFLRISNSMLHLFPVDTLEEMIGKSDFDFQPKDVAQSYYEDEMQIIKSGKGVIDEVVHEVMENGVEQWVSSTKLPLYNNKGECIGTFGISKIITELKQQEQKTLDKTIELEKVIEKKDKKIAELNAKLKK